MGRFITPDTIIPEPYNPQSLNRYAYCLNNPLIYTDPTGRTGEDFVGPPVPPDYVIPLDDISITRNGPSVFAFTTFDYTWPLPIAPSLPSLAGFGEKALEFLAADAAIVGSAVTVGVTIVLYPSDLANSDLTPEKLAQYKAQEEKAKDGLETDKSQTGKKNGPKQPDSVDRVERDKSGARGDRHVHGKDGDWSVNEDGTMHDNNPGRVPKDAVDYLRSKGFNIPEDRYPLPNKK